MNTRIFISTRILAFAVFALVAANPLLQAGPQPVTAIRAGQSPEIDGKLGDPVWADAKWREDFSELDIGKPAETATRFAIAYDDRFLYVAIRCAEPTLDKIKAAVVNRDDPQFSNDDVVELFVAPGPQRTDYYQFEFNSKGVIADSASHQSGTVRDAAWNSATQAATSFGKREWMVEIAIPLADLDLGKPAPGDWGINVVRVRRASETEQRSTFVPMTGSLHQPALFAALSLPEESFDALRWELSAPMGLTVLRDDGVTVVKAKLSVKNLTGKLRPLAVKPRLRQGEKIAEGRSVLDILDAGQSKTYEIVLPLPGDGPQQFEVEVADRRDPRALFIRRTFAVNLAFMPFSLRLREPAYQDAIYATQKIEQISGSLVLNLSVGELKGASAVVSLLPQDAAAKAIAETTIESLSQNVDFNLPTPTLTEERYLLRVALLDAKGKATHTLERVIRKLPPAPSGVEWRMNESGVLLRNGEPFLPVGWWSLPAAAMRETASNVTWLYMGPWQTVDVLRKALDEIGAVGGYGMIYPTVNNRRPEDLTVAPISEQDGELIRERVRALKDHPALLGWYLADEPEYHHVLPESVKQLRSLISEEDPWHPTIVVNNAFGAIRQFASGGDIIAPDPYPFFKRGGMSPAMGKVGAHIAEATAAAMPGQAVWVVPQAHDTRDFGGKDERGPTFAECRNMVWQAVSAGARGVVWWDWGWTAPNMIDSVYGNAYLARELNALRAYVLAPVEDGLDIAAPQKEMLRAALRTAGGQHALFAANAASAPQDVDIKVAALAGRELIVLGEGRTVRVAADGTLTEHFDPYGTHIYLTDATFADYERMEAVQKNIDAANAARRHPGNCAFEDSGVTVRVSSQAFFQPTPVWLVDGVREGRSWKAMPFAGNDWIELHWPKPQNIGRVTLFTDAIADAEIQVAEGDDAKPVWHSVATVKDALTDSIEVTFDPIKASRLRVSISRLRAGADATRIREIEAYQK